MLTTSALAETAALVGDPARAGMLMALMDGRALTAGELARVAGVTPQTASGHLAKMATAGLLATQRQGRHHYHRLASAAVAHMLESIMEVSASEREKAGRAVVTGPRDEAMRAARVCWNHLAGELGVALADGLVARGHLELSAEGGAMTDAGAAFFRDFGLDLDAFTALRRRPRVLPAVPRLERAPFACRRRARPGARRPLFRAQLDSPLRRLARGQRDPGRPARLPRDFRPLIPIDTKQATLGNPRASQSV
jgi:DNA-binding transcriptional ArsR family regulator